MAGNQKFLSSGYVLMRQISLLKTLTLFLKPVKLKPKSFIKEFRMIPLTKMKEMFSDRLLQGFSGISSSIITISENG